MRTSNPHRKIIADPATKRTASTSRAPAKLRVPKSSGGAGGGGGALRSPRSPGSTASSPRRGLGDSKDARYVAGLKEQIHYLELECSVLRSKKQGSGHGATSVLSSSTRNAMNSSFASAVALEASISELTDKCRILELEHKTELDKRDLEREELLEELSHTRTELDAAVNEVRLIQTRAEDIIEEHTRGMQKELEMLVKTMNEETSAKDRLVLVQEQFDSIDAQFREERSQWKEKESSISEENRRLHEELRFYQNRVEELEGSCGVDRKRLQDLEAKNESFESETFKLNEKITELEVARDNLVAELAQTRNNLQNLQESHQFLSTENEQLVGLNATLNEQVRHVKQKLAEYASHEGEAVRKRSEALEEVESLRLKLETMEKQVVHTKTVLDDEYAEREKIVMDLTRATAELQDKCVAVRAISGELDLAKQRALKAEDHTAKLVAQIASLNTKCKLIENEESELKKQLLEAAQGKAWAEDQCTRMKEKIELQSDLQDLNVGEFQRVIQSNLQLASQFDAFLRKHKAEPVPETDESR